MNIRRKCCRQRFGFRGWLYARMWGTVLPTWANGKWLLTIFDVSMAQFQSI